MRKCLLAMILGVMTLSAIGCGDDKPAPVTDNMKPTGKPQTGDMPKPPPIPPPPKG